MGKYGQSLRMKWNYTSTDTIYLCGIIYTSGLQTPQLASPHIHLRATGEGPGWLSGAPQLLDQKKGPQSCTHGFQPLDTSSPSCFSWLWLNERVHMSTGGSVRDQIYQLLGFCVVVFQKEMGGNTVTLTWKSLNFERGQSWIQFWLNHMLEKTDT